MTHLLQITFDFEGTSLSLAQTSILSHLPQKGGTLILEKKGSKKWPATFTAYGLTLCAGPQNYTHIHVCMLSSYSPADQAHVSPYLTSISYPATLHH